MHELNPIQMDSISKKDVFEIDRSVALAEITKIVEVTARQILRYLDIPENTDLKTEEGKQVHTILQKYLEIFYDTEKSQANMAAAERLIDVLLPKVELIKVDEFINIAKQLVDDCPTSTIPLWMPPPKFKEASFDSKESRNSNEFMAKLVIFFAKLSQKEVLFFDEKKLPNNHDDIYIIDDAIYSGRQLWLFLRGWPAKIQHPIKVKLYSARASKEGIKRIQHGLQSPAIDLEVYVNKTISTLDQELGDNLEATIFFLVEGLETHLYNLDVHNPNILLKDATTFMQSMTLTTSEARIVDFLSMPRFLGEGAKAVRETREYPPVNI